ncbi:Fatty-acid-binding protein 1 [Hibiscus syriacus]|uniref:Fatty-acid-binding protein 1 n=1 Tax=Hibiscus syriacus TaxID=106335 RepID=A0A6A3CMZ5_HIBSY|nr:fatty-acid-binding protein 1 [Hibiscus syriacus]KAE8729874.1 Fatty-acid-binding protein 1 [Hibiscus syriacus]
MSLRFPFLFSQPNNQPGSGNFHNNHRTTSRQRFSASLAVAAAASIGAVAAAGVAAVSQNPNHPLFQNATNLLLPNSSSLLLASISLADGSDPVVEPKSGVSFPPVLGNSLRLLGVGLRRKSILGLKNIDVYAFGVYANGDDVKKFLSAKYGNLSASELKDNKDLKNDLMEADISMTVRLQIVYGKLTIRSIRSAYEESVGSRLQKFGGGSDNKELLHRFTSQFKDEYKLPRGSLVDLSKEPGYVLKTIIDGKEIGSIESKLLCRSILDLYIGEDPFDKRAKEDVDHNVTSILVQK